MSDDKQYNSILEYLKDHPPGPFKPGFYYNVDGDMLEAYWSDKPAFAEDVSSRVAVEKDFETGEVVGVKLFGVYAEVIKNSKLFDPEPVTEDWLTKLGWKKTYPDSWRPPYEVVKRTAEFLYSLTSPDAERVVLGDPEPAGRDEGRDRVYVRCDNTRGGLRRLCFGLGIPLNEKGWV